MAELTPQAITAAGQAPTTATPAGGGDFFDADITYVYVIHYTNGSGSPQTVTVNDPTSTGPEAAASFNPDLAVSVTNGTNKLIRIDPRRFRDPATGQVDITYSAVSSATISVYQIER